MSLTLLYTPMRSTMVALVAHDHPRLDVDREEHGPLVALELAAHLVGRGGVGRAIGAGAVPEAAGDAALEHDPIVDGDVRDRHDRGADGAGVEGLLHVALQVGREFVLVHVDGRSARCDGHDPPSA